MEISVCNLRLVLIIVIFFMALFFMSEKTIILNWFILFFSIAVYCLSLKLAAWKSGTEINIFE